MKEPSEITKLSNFFIKVVQKTARNTKSELGQFPKGLFYVYFKHLCYGGNLNVSIAFLKVILAFEE